MTTGSAADAAIGDTCVSVGDGAVVSMVMNSVSRWPDELLHLCPILLKKENICPVLLDFIHFLSLSEF